MAVFRPYRRTFMRVFSRCFPEDVRQRLYQSTTTFAVKGNLTIASSHLSRYTTRLVGLLYLILAIGEGFL